MVFCLSPAWHVWARCWECSCLAHGVARLGNLSELVSSYRMLGGGKWSAKGWVCSCVHTGVWVAVGVWGHQLAV